MTVIKNKLCLALALLLATMATAQQQWRIGLNTGLLVGGGELTHKGAPGLGGQLIYNFTDIYSLELAVNGYEAKKRDGGGRVDLLTPVLTARAHFSPLTPSAALYAGAGMGLYSVNDREADESQIRTRAHVALGAEYRLHRDWELFADYRFTFIHLLNSDNFNHGLLRAGVNRFF